MRLGARRAAGGGAGWMAAGRAVLGAVGAAAEAGVATGRQWVSPGPLHLSYHLINSLGTRAVEKPGPGERLVACVLELGACPPDGPGYPSAVPAGARPLLAGALCHVQPFFPNRCKARQNGATGIPTFGEPCVNQESEVLAKGVRDHTSLGPGTASGHLLPSGPWHARPPAAQSCWGPRGDPG